MEFMAYTAETKIAKMKESRHHDVNKPSGVKGTELILPNAVLFFFARLFSIPVFSKFKEKSNPHVLG